MDSTTNFDATPCLIRGGLLHRDDAPLLADDDGLPVDGKVIVSLARWRAERDTLAAHGVGVLIPNTEDVVSVYPELIGVRLIALDFPTTADGRAFSQARLLRERCAYTGELRATGAVARDQLQFMERCGFDAFLLRADQDAVACLAAFKDLTIAYQRAVDATAMPNVLAMRRAWNA